MLLCPKKCHITQYLSKRLSPEVLKYFLLLTVVASFSSGTLNSVEFVNYSTELTNSTAC